MKSSSKKIISLNTIYFLLQRLRISDTGVYTVFERVSRNCLMSTVTIKVRTQQDYDKYTQMFPCKLLINRYTPFPVSALHISGRINRRASDGLFIFVIAVGMRELLLLVTSISVLTVSSIACNICSNIN